MAKQSKAPKRPMWVKVTRLVDPASGERELRQHYGTAEQLQAEIDA